ncbi:MAG: hypothetical protein Q7J84_03920 [Sulfuricaulis sp.]|nr:hypothetical protein [Sulfuricaulis sp.]
MTVKLETTIQRFIGDTADSKPTGVRVGSTYLDRQTSILYTTYDGTNWVAKSTIAKLAANSGVDIGDVDVLSIAAGTNLIGKVGIDQTTPGTTNKVIADPVAATPTPYNLTLTNADTEYSQAMPANCRKFWFQCRSAVDVRYAYVTGKVAASTAPFITMKAGGYAESPAIAQGAAPSTIYLASAIAGVVIEFEAWV